MSYIEFHATRYCFERCVNIDVSTTWNLYEKKKTQTNKHSHDNLKHWTILSFYNECIFWKLWQNIFLNFKSDDLFIYSSNWKAIARMTFVWFVYVLWRWQSKTPRRNHFVHRRFFYLSVHPSICLSRFSSAGATAFHEKLVNHHIKNSAITKDRQLLYGDCLISYVVTAIYPAW